MTGTQTGPPGAPPGTGGDALPPAPAPAPAAPPAGPGRLRAALSMTGLYVASIAVALGLSAVLVMVTHGSPGDVFSALYQGSVQDWGSFGYTLQNATPLLIVAVGTMICHRAGHFNIGQEGQLTIGATTAGFVALRLHAAGPLVIVLALLAGAAGGALWAGICALLRFWRGIDVVISSLLLIFVAFQVLSYTLNTPKLLQEHVEGANLTESGQLGPNVRLPHFGSYPDLNFGLGLIIALVLAVVVWVLMARTRWGLRVRLLGLNPVAAKRAGVSAVALGTVAIVLSGAFAGFAGGVMLTGQAYRLSPTFSNNIGWDGLLVALLARNNAMVAIPVALFFGALEAGGGFLATTGVPTDLVNIVQALLVLAAVFPPALVELRKYRRARAFARASAAGGPTVEGAAA